MTQAQPTANQTAAATPAETLAEVYVSSPCRLHFGLLSWGQPDRAEFGGVGMMIAPPRIELRAIPAEAFSVAGPHRRRVEQFAARWAESRGVADLPAYRLEVKAAPAEHTGLGLGTALGLTVAAALETGCGYPAETSAELAARVGRGRRSAIGTHGFEQGGFIFERGKQPGESLGELAARQSIPADWRVVLARPRQEGGVFGAAEEQAFARLPAVRAEVTTQLLEEIEARMLPALAVGDCSAFGESVYQYGRTAGECFATAQGGPYASSEVAELVAWLRAAGVAGVGQSSWGPTVFAIVPSQQQAEELAEKLASRETSFELEEVSIATGDNTGAVVRRMNP